MAADPTGVRPLDRVDRPRGRQAPVDRRLLGRQARPDLQPRAAPRATRRGQRDELAAMLAEGLSIRAMAERLDRSYTGVRHWLARHGLQTPRAARLAETAAARAAGAATVEAMCPVHGVTQFVRRGADGFRCRLCRMEAVDRRRREIKQILVAEAGGAAWSAATTVRCARCSSITSTRRRRRSASAPRYRRGLSRARVRRPPSAFCSAQTVMRKSRQGSLLSRRDRPADYPDVGHMVRIPVRGNSIGRMLGC